jgi:hypothetical protein
MFSQQRAPGLAIQAWGFLSAGFWGEFENTLVSEPRRAEDSIPLDQVKAKLALSGRVRV